MSSASKEDHVAAPVRILIVDDHEVVRKGIRLILNDARPGWEICGEASNGVEAIDAATHLKPDVILLDITMPGMSGLEAASHISAPAPPAQIWSLTFTASAKPPVKPNRGARKATSANPTPPATSSKPSKHCSPAEPSLANPKKRPTKAAESPIPAFTSA